MVVIVLFFIKGYVVLWWNDAFKNTVNCCTVMEGKKSSAIIKLLFQKWYQSVIQWRDFMVLEMKNNTTH
jgi:hypothetical protein